jgi:Leucine-rich repeat (LRR) protein
VQFAQNSTSFQLTLIRPLQFDQNPRLISLSMANNLITELHANTFFNLVSLESLDFGINQITRLPGTLLRANTRLVSLGARRNGIESIQNNFFSNLTHLRFINLQSNACINRFFSIFRTLAIDVDPFLDLCYRNFN